MKREYFNNITINLKNLKGKQEIKNLKASFSKECEVILGNLFVDLSLKFDDMKKVVSKN